MDRNQTETRESSSETDADENFSQDRVELPPLSDLFKDVQTKLEHSVNDGGWALTDIETAVYLHDALLSLRHWSDDIKNEESTVLKTVEEHDAGLASTVRLCLNDISSDVSNFRHYYEDKASEKSR
jgi:hypothetical protein